MTPGKRIEAYERRPRTHDVEREQETGQGEANPTGQEEANQAEREMNGLQDEFLREWNVDVQDEQEVEANGREPERVNIKDNRK